MFNEFQNMPQDAKVIYFIIAMAALLGLGYGAVILFRETVKLFKRSPRKQAKTETEVTHGN